MALRRGVDISNYTGELTDAHVRDWQQRGFEFAIVGTQNGPIARQQLATCFRLGYPCEAYQEPAWNADPWQWYQTAVDVVQPFAGRVVRFWLAVEEDLASGRMSVQLPPLELLAKLVWGVRVIEHAGYRVGIYTRPDFWREHAGDASLFSDLPLWNARPGGSLNPAEGFESYGGWVAPVATQYAWNFPQDFDTEVDW